MDDFLRRQRLLVISPHADDETYGCAGTIARIKALGGEVFIMVISIGDLKHYKKEETLVKKEVRKEEFIKTAKLLKVDDYDIVYEQTERHLRLDVIPRRELIAVIERESSVSIDRIKPTMVALPAISYNQDHCAVFHAGFTACRPHLPDIKPFQKIVVSYDNPTLFWNTEYEKFHPNFYVDISKYLDVKLKAMSLHKTQLRGSLHHCSIENLKNLVRLRGREISVEAAEAFMCYRFVL